MNRDIYTIGYALHDIGSFIDHLRRHEVTAIADIRSLPYSRFHAQFDREKLNAALERAGITYLYLGRELGARSRDWSCYVNDQLQYHLLAQTQAFRAGLDDVIKQNNKHRLALMAAEHEPLNCHRAILVARELVKLGHDVQHILADGSVESHEHSLSRLINQLVLRNADNELFRDSNTLEDWAYARQAERLAHRRKWRSLQRR